MSNRPNPSRPAARPTGAPDVYDADALMAEFDHESKQFRLGGQVFDLPHPSSWSDDTLEASAREDIVQACRLIMGDDYDRYKEAGGNAMFLNKLVAKMFGAEMGESSGSSSS